MDTFAREAFKLGTLGCFRHFSVELRGREEMLLTIEVPASLAGHLRLVPMRAQQALPPASPCHRERSPAPWEDGSPPTANATITCVFLIAGYAHYNCPLAWIRSGHKVFGSEFTGNLDAPVELSVTSDWKSRTVHAFEFVAELILESVHPRPLNPFELELAAVKQLALTDQMLLSGALASFLRDVHLSSAEYAPRVEADLLAVLSMHYSRLPKFVSHIEGGDGRRRPLPPYVSRTGTSQLSAESPVTPYVRPHGFAVAGVAQAQVPVPARRPSPLVTHHQQAQPSPWPPSQQQVQMQQMPQQQMTTPQQQQTMPYAPPLAAAPSPKQPPAQPMPPQPASAMRPAAQAAMAPRPPPGQYPRGPPPSGPPPRGPPPTGRPPTGPPRGPPPMTPPPGRR